MSDTQTYFETRTELTLEEYKRFDKWMHKNLTGMNRIFTIAKIILIALCIVLAVFSWKNGDMIRTIGELILAVLIFPVFSLVHTISAQRTYQMIHKQARWCRCQIYSIVPRSYGAGAKAGKHTDCV